MFDWRKLYENLMISISEQAYDKKKTENLITNEVSPLSEHIIKLLKWEDSISNPKHVIDINQKWLDRIQDVLARSTIPMKKDTLQRIIVRETMNIYKKLMNKLTPRYDIRYKGTLKAYRSDEEVKELLEDILTELSAQLFNSQYNQEWVTIEAIFDKLEIHVYGI